MIGVSIEGTEELKKVLDNFAFKVLRKRVERAVHLSGFEVQETAIKSIQRTSIASMPVTRYSPKRTARRSPPGQPPNTDTGRLVASIQVDFRDMAVAVGSNLNYAKWLEFGTENMAARPWLRPALKKNTRKIKNAVRKVVNQEIRKLGR